MHWSIMPAVVMTRISFPATQQPPDWLKAVVLIVAALLLVVATAEKFNALTTDILALESTTSS